MKFIAIGDNVVDCYLDERIYFPGGNAVNVAVNCKRNGVEHVNYIGIFGNDEKADHIKNSLREEGVTFERSRKVYAPSATPGVRLENGDRVFVPGGRESCQHLFAIQLSKEDFMYIANYDLCHTSCYSHLENELPELSKIIPVSFDYSLRRDEEYLKQTAPYVSYAFFSGSDMSEEECNLFAQKVRSYGVGVVGITRGEDGAIFYNEKGVYSSEIYTVDVVDTMGAGDSFIAGFLASYFKDHDMEKSLKYASRRAAHTCTLRGGFGHAHPFE